LVRPTSHILLKLGMPFMQQQLSLLFFFCVWAGKPFVLNLRFFKSWVHYGISLVLSSNPRALPLLYLVSFGIFELC
jgi:hypothetical protein